MELFSELPGRSNSDSFLVIGLLGNCKSILVSPVPAWLSVFIATLELGGWWGEAEEIGLGQVRIPQTFLFLLRFIWFSWINTCWIVTSLLIYFQNAEKSLFWQNLPVFLLLLWRSRFLKVIPLPFWSVPCHFCIFYLHPSPIFWSSLSLLAFLLYISHGPLELSVSMTNMLIFSSIRCYFSFLPGSPFRGSFSHIPHKSKPFIRPLNITTPQVSDLCPFFCLCILLSEHFYPSVRLPNLSSSLPRSLKLNICVPNCA